MKLVALALVVASLVVSAVPVGARQGDNVRTTAHEKTVASAMLNLQHAAAPADRPKLEALMKDQSAPEPVRTLAGVLVRLNHSPSSADKSALAKLATAK
jgi:hypothetical protein